MLIVDSDGCFASLLHIPQSEVYGGSRAARVVAREHICLHNSLQQTGLAMRFCPDHNHL